MGLGSIRRWFEGSSEIEAYELGITGSAQSGSDEQNTSLRTDGKTTGRD